MAQFPFAKQLLDQANGACVALAFPYYRELEHGVFMPDTPSATLTFLRCKGRTFALTAAHVIDGFRSSVEKPSEHRLLILHAPGHVITGDFRRAPAPLIGAQPDVAWCEVAGNLPLQFEKEAYEFTDKVVPSPVPFAVAAGYPTDEKRGQTTSSGQWQLRLRGAFSRAEGISYGDGDQVQFFSEIREPSNVLSMSGMSGGPVFWHTDMDFGFLGTVKQCMEATESEEETLQGGPHVHFLAQRIRYEDFVLWIA